MNKKIENTETKGAFRRSKLAGQTGHFKKEIQYLFSLFSKLLLEPITAVRTILKYTEIAG